MQQQSSMAANVSAWRGQDARETLPFVDAMIGYPGTFEGRGRIDQYDVSKRNIVVSPVCYRVRDARPIVDGLSLDREGFTLIESPSACLEEPDMKVLGRNYMHELAPVIKKLTGASCVIPRERGIIVRSAANGVVGNRAGAQISVLVHADFTHNSVSQLLPHIGGAPENFSRVVIIQTWRALTPAPQDFPLTVCDSSSVARDEVVIVDSVIGPPDVPGNVFDSAIVHPNAKHRWYYFSDMQPHEVIVWKGYDSAVPESMNVFHTAFDNREKYPSSVSRRSLEARFFAFYE